MKLAFIDQVLTVMATEVVVWLPWWVATEDVGQNSFDRYGLIIVYLYIQSLVILPLQKSDLPLSINFQASP